TACPTHCDDGCDCATTPAPSRCAASALADATSTTLAIGTRTTGLPTTTTSPTSRAATTPSSTTADGACDKTSRGTLPGRATSAGSMLSRPPARDRAGRSVGIDQD